VTLGADGQDVTFGTGNDTLDVNGLIVTGSLIDVETLQVSSSGANISGALITNAAAAGATTNGQISGTFIDFDGSTATLTVAVSQNETMRTTGLVTNAAAGTQTLVIHDAGTLTGIGSIENYVLSNSGNTFTQVLGNTSVTGGSGNDTIITDSTDATRAALTIQLGGGGTDTVRILNTGISGLGGALVDDATGLPVMAVMNNTTLNNTIAMWDGTSGTSAVTITGFTAGNDGDKVKYLDGATSVLVGGFAGDVDISANNLASLAPNSVIEISADTVQIADGTNLGAVATILSQLNNVQDGHYYVVIYDGDGANANAYLYAAVATEGDFFDFADINGNTNGYDTDTVELIGFMQNVGANAFTSLNFI
jgi:hypothetical protein